MPEWSPEVLDAIGEAQEVDVAPLRPDGGRQRATIVWVVRVGDELDVRSFRGPDGRWFRAALRSHQGVIRTGGLEREVSFEEVGGADRDAIDGAYRRKYRRSSYVGAMVDDAVAATTLRLRPR